MHYVMYLSVLFGKEIKKNKKTPREGKKEP
jgi:hypothetical protein